MLHIWEHQIQLAEQNRVKDIKVMDIYSAQIPSTSGPVMGSALDSKPSLQDINQDINGWNLHWLSKKLSVYILGYN